MRTRQGEDIHDDLFRESVADIEKHIIINALKRTGGNQTLAARQLGTTKRIFAYRVRKYNIDAREFRHKGHQDNNPEDSTSSQDK